MIVWPGGFRVTKELTPGEVSSPASHSETKVVLGMLQEQLSEQHCLNSIPLLKGNSRMFRN